MKAFNDIISSHCFCTVNSTVVACRWELREGGVMEGGSNTNKQQEKQREREITFFPISKFTSSTFFFFEIIISLIHQEESTREWEKKTRSQYNGFLFNNFDLCMILKIHYYERMRIIQTPKKKIVNVQNVGSLPARELDKRIIHSINTQKNILKEA